MRSWRHYKRRLCDPSPTCAVNLTVSCHLREERYDLLSETVHRLLVIGHPWEAQDEIVESEGYLLLECLRYLIGRSDHPAARILLIAGRAARHRRCLLRILANSNDV